MDPELASWAVGGPGPAVGSQLGHVVSTVSIVATDGRDLGVAAASRVLAVGAIVPWARAGLGAVATQARVNVGWKRDAERLLAAGLAAEAVVERLVALDENPASRQLLVLDGGGGAGAYTGLDCVEWAGHLISDGCAAGGNMLVGPAVIARALEAFANSSGPLALRLERALSAADLAGGDKRGRESAVLVIRRDGAGIEGRDDALVDLRVDHSDDAVKELSSLVPLALAEAESWASGD